MRYKQINVTGLLNIIFFLFPAGFIVTACAQPTSPPQLFTSSIFTSPGSFTNDVEGPSVDKYGMVYAVNFAKKGTIGQVTASGKAAVFITLPEGSIGNGTRFDSEGNMIIADYTKHNILKVDMVSKALRIVAHEPRMTQPNDIAIDSKDRIYASDPDFKTNTGRFWRIDRSGKVTLLDSMGAANGIDISPDEKTIFVNAGRAVWAYDLSPAGEVSNRRLLIEFPDFGVDGMRCDVKGNLYVARIGKGTVIKISANGRIIREIALTGKKPTNVAFGGKDGCTMYVTLMDNGNLESFRVDEPGREWQMQRKRNK
jgi:sugar lactone lactonase YvrE